MSQVRISVRQLAQTYRLDPAALMGALRAHGVALTGTHQRIVRHQSGLARLVAAQIASHETVRRTRGPDTGGLRSDEASEPQHVAPATPRPEGVRSAREKTRVSEAPSAPRWPSQKTESITWLTVDDVLAIHEALEDEFSGTADAVEPPGVKDQGALESAVLRAQTAKQLYSTVLLAGSALVHALNSNHAFHNGNKRTSLLALAIFLEERNARYLTATEDDLYALIVDAARHTLVDPAESPGRGRDPYYSDREVLEIHKRLRAMVVVPTKNDKPMRWRDFVRTIERFGCEVGGLDSNQAKIRRDLPDGRCLTAVAGARNAGAEISAWQVRGYRKQLELTDDHGIDSGVFYDGLQPHPDLPELVKRYRGVLERLSLLDRVGSDEDRESQTGPG